MSNICLRVLMSLVFGLALFVFGAGCNGESSSGEQESIKAPSKDQAPIEPPAEKNQNSADPKNKTDEESPIKPPPPPPPPPPPEPVVKPAPAPAPAPVAPQAPPAPKIKLGVVDLEHHLPVALPAKKLVIPADDVNPDISKAASSSSKKTKSLFGQENHRPEPAKSDQYGAPRPAVRVGSSFVSHNKGPARSPFSPTNGRRGGNMSFSGPVVSPCSSPTTKALLTKRNKEKAHAEPLTLDYRMFDVFAMPDIEPMAGVPMAKTSKEGTKPEFSASSLFRPVAFELANIDLEEVSAELLIDSSKPDSALVSSSPEQTSVFTASTSSSSTSDSFIAAETTPHPAADVDEVSDNFRSSTTCEKALTKSSKIDKFESPPAPVLTKEKFSSFAREFKFLDYATQDVKALSQRVSKGKIGFINYLADQGKDLKIDVLIDYLFGLKALDEDLVKAEIKKLTNEKDLSVILNAILDEGSDELLLLAMRGIERLDWLASFGYENRNYTSINDTPVASFFRKIFRDLARRGKNEDVKRLFGFLINEAWSVQIGDMDEGVISLIEQGFFPKEQLLMPLPASSELGSDSNMSGTLLFHVLYKTAHNFLIRKLKNKDGFWIDLEISNILSKKIQGLANEDIREKFLANGDVQICLESVPKSLEKNDIQNLVTAFKKHLSDNEWNELCRNHHNGVNKNIQVWQLLQITQPPGAITSESDAASADYLDYTP